jgi:hypothetical protein
MFHSVPGSKGADPFFATMTSLLTLREHSAGVGLWPYFSTGFGRERVRLSFQLDLDAYLSLRDRPTSFRHPVSRQRMSP